VSEEAFEEIGFELAPKELLMMFGGCTADDADEDDAMEDARVRQRTAADRTALVADRTGSLARRSDGAQWKIRRERLREVRVEGEDGEDGEDAYLLRSRAGEKQRDE
jgi:hypothetical protein